MHLSITLFDGEDEPRTFLIEPQIASAEAILTFRLMRAIRLTIGANRVSTDLTQGVTYPSIPSSQAEKFETAYLALYLNPEALRELMAAPEKFPQILRRFLPKEPKA